MARSLFLSILASLAIAHAASAHQPGSDGGPADRGCKPVLNQTVYVGATNMACSNARRIAKRGVQGEEKRGWSCTGLGSNFGHCHGSRHRLVHWADNH